MSEKLERVQVVPYKWGHALLWRGRVIDEGYGDLRLAREMALMFERSPEFLAERWEQSTVWVREEG